ncbi:MAG: nucleoside-diphosphate sugar epimerase [Microbacterium sp. 69-10]|uniref:NmrA family NAD(P)-binding protein n=1 Tax=Microbacterium sp. 69-10 TaxID=1895783 RepID=UPI000967F60A|nr:NAD(P)H-binding protein [Microbacterium sp. 69-10]OJU39940.1 MAG: nucleoside-diphosphate sugar epimerase [Microbacterium sp. 69-10]
MIVVTGSTGQIGSIALRSLVERGEEVRAVARHPERLPEDLRKRIDVVAGSHVDRDVIDGALDGAEALLWLAPSDPAAASPYEAYVAATIPAADAVVRHAVHRVVTISALGQGVQMYAGHVSASHAMDDLFRSTGADMRVLANATFLDNLLRQRADIARGIISATVPADLRMPWVATRDIGAVAAETLADRSWTGQEVIEVMGPEDLSYNDVAATLSEVLGTPIRFVPGDREADIEAMIGYGFSPAMARSAMAMDLAAERGINNAAVRTPHNATPTTLREFAVQVLQPAMDR